MRKNIELAAVGAAAGAVNGIFGTGGGTVIVLALMWMLKDSLDDGRAVFANAPAAILPIAVVSAITYSSFSPPDMGRVVMIALSALGGGILGAVLLGRLRTRVLKIIFASVMIISGGMMLFR